MLEQLLKLKEKYQPVEDKVETVIGKGQDIIYKGRMMDYEEGKLSETKASATIIRGMIKVGHGCLIEHMMHKKIKRELVSLGLYKEDEIAIDINEFLAMSGKAKVIMSSIDYRANIKKDYLKGLELVWSDACFLALDDASYVSNLRYVMGNLSVRNINDVTNIEHVEGTIVSTETDLVEQSETKKVYTK